MKTVQEKRFRVQNLDCAACAAKIERELQKTEGIEEAVLDFATLTLHLKAVNIPKALEAVTRIEPQVKLTPMERNTPTDDPPEGKGIGKQIGIIIVAGVINIGHLLFEDQFHLLTWAWVEYATAIMKCPGQSWPVKYKDRWGEYLPCQQWSLGS